MGHTNVPGRSKKVKVNVGGWWERLLPSSHLYPGCGCRQLFHLPAHNFLFYFFFFFTCNVFSPSISQGLETWCTQNIQEVNYGSAVVQKWQLLPWRLPFSKPRPHLRLCKNHQQSCLRRPDLGETLVSCLGATEGYQRRQKPRTLAWK